VWHLANQGQATWLEFGQLAAEAMGMDRRCYEGVSWEALSLKAARPTFSALGTEKGIQMPSLEDALSRYCHEQCTLSI
jgi:dTDP-4-dehydrorhamnose reductase